MVFTDKNQIGEVIKYYRKKSGLTQAELAEKIGLSEKHVSKIERGQNIIKLDTFLKMAEILNFTLEDFGLQKTSTDSPNKSEKINSLISMINKCSEKEYTLIHDLVAAVIKNSNKL
ncbi:helix-turn-helix transcriptional regulator [bacterium]|nr:helix-turn-helix transcriptional regulator [bacterium]